MPTIFLVVNYDNQYKPEFQQRRGYTYSTQQFWVNARVRRILPPDISIHNVWMFEDVEQTKMYFEIQFSIYVSFALLESFMKKNIFFDYYVIADTFPEIDQWLTVFYESGAKNRCIIWHP